jgi:NAD(P)-dependent dehydrogenase (short-subunit alcohol dehydrogenase family)
MENLKGKVALVTGAGSGIGKAAALLLAKNGAKIGALGRQEDEIQQTAQEIRAAGGDVHLLVADISNPEMMAEAYRNLFDRWKRLDIIFANAGINGVWASIEDLKPEEWDETLTTNLRGTFLTLKYAVPYMKETGGSMIVTSSINGTRVFSNSGASAYSSSKAGQVALAKMLALELAKYHIRVNVICPGWIETNIQENTQQRDLEQVQEPVEFPNGEVPLTEGRAGRPEQVAQLVLFLASEHSDLITGTEIWIDGGESLLKG